MESDGGSVPDPLDLGAVPIGSGTALSHTLTLTGANLAGDVSWELLDVQPSGVGVFALSYDSDGAGTFTRLAAADALPMTSVAAGVAVKLLYEPPASGNLGAVTATFKLIADSVAVSIPVTLTLTPALIDAGPGEQQVANLSSAPDLIPAAQAATLFDAETTANLRVPTAYTIGIAPSSVPQYFSLNLPRGGEYTFETSVFSGSASVYMRIIRRTDADRILAKNHSGSGTTGPTNPFTYIIPKAPKCVYFHAPTNPGAHFALSITELRKPIYLDAQAVGGGTLPDPLDMGEVHAAGDDVTIPFHLSGGGLADVSWTLEDVAPAVPDLFALSYDDNGTDTPWPAGRGLPGAVVDAGIDVTLTYYTPVGADTGRVRGRLGFTSGPVEKELEVSLRIRQALVSAENGGTRDNALASPNFLSTEGFAAFNANLVVSFSMPRATAATDGQYWKLNLPPGNYSFEGVPISPSTAAIFLAVYACDNIDDSGSAELAKNFTGFESDSPTGHTGKPFEHEVSVNSGDCLFAQPSEDPGTHFLVSVAKRVDGPAITIGPGVNSNSLRGGPDLLTTEQLAEFNANFSVLLRAPQKEGNRYWDINLPPARYSFEGLSIAPDSGAVFLAVYGACDSGSDDGIYGTALAKNFAVDAAAPEGHTGEPFNFLVPMLPGDSPKRCLRARSDTSGSHLTIKITKYAVLPSIRVVDGVTGANLPKPLTWAAHVAGDAVSSPAVFLSGVSLPADVSWEVIDPTPDGVGSFSLSYDHEGVDTSLVAGSSLPQAIASAGTRVHFTYTPPETGAAATVTAALKFTSDSLTSAVSLAVDLLSPEVRIEPPPAAVALESGAAELQAVDAAHHLLPAGSEDVYGTHGVVALEIPAAWRSVNVPVIGPVSLPGEQYYELNVPPGVYSFEAVGPSLYTDKAYVRAGACDASVSSWEKNYSAVITKSEHYYEVGTPTGATVSLRYTVGAAVSCLGVLHAKKAETFKIKVVSHAGASSPSPFPLDLGASRTAGEAVSGAFYVSGSVGAGVSWTLADISPANMGVFALSYNETGENIPLQVGEDLPASFINLGGDVVVTYTPPGAPLDTDDVVPVAATLRLALGAVVQEEVSVSVSLSTDPNTVEPDPSFASPLEVAASETRASVSFAPAVSGKYYWVVQLDSVSPAPSSSQVWAGEDGTGTAVVEGLTGPSGGTSMRADVAVDFSIVGLTAGTSYNLFVLLESSSGVVGTVEQAPFTTETPAAPEEPTGDDDRSALRSVMGPVLSPNPVQDVLYITHSVPHDYRVAVYTLGGRPVLRAVLSGGQLPDSLDVTALSPGVYILQIETAASAISRRFVRR